MPLSKYFAINAYNFIQVIILGSVIAITIKSVRNKYPSSLILLISQTFLVIGTLIILLSLANILPRNDFNLNFALPTGYVLEMILFSFALGNKIKILRSDYSSKQNEILEQLERKQELQTKVTRELKSKVEVRTAEILTQQNEIEQQTSLLKSEIRKSDDLLLNILPGFAIQELKQTGKTAPRHHKNATVIFIDIVGFTKIAEKLNAEELVQELDYCFKNFDEIVIKHGLEKIKTIGDAYLCVGGVPVQKDSSTKDAVRASLDLLGFTKQWNAKRVKEGKAPWDIRIGIHTGPAISGVVGKDKYSFDIWGDTVQIANRMESFGIPGEVNISQTTFEIVKDHFSFQPNAKEVKDYNLPNMYLVEESKVA